jgi:AcrR family transcriptional regulator
VKKEPEKPDKKDAILEIAEKLFSELGFDAASTRQIAAHAGVNMAMLNYYFGSKEGLYKSVLERRLANFRQTLASINEQNISCLQKLDMAVEVFADRIIANTCFHRLIHRALSLPERTGISEVIVDNLFANVNEIKRILEDGISEGVFRNVDVEMTIATFFGTKYYLVNSTAIASKLLGKDLSDPKVLEEDVKPRLKQHLKDILKSHLTNHDKQVK